MRHQPQPAATSPSSRTLGLAACIALVMGNMIGSGVFLLPASLAPFGWDAVAGWVFTIAGSLVLAFVIARLTVAMPDVSASQMIARAYGPLAGFAISSSPMTPSRWRRPPISAALCPRSPGRAWGRSVRSASSG